jgi:hypothetical protein
MCLKDANIFLLTKWSINLIINLMAIFFTGWMAKCLTNDKFKRLIDQIEMFSPLLCFKSINKKVGVNQKVGIHF